MELFGIGPLELLFILIIALVVLGPRDMVKAGRSVGRFLRKTILSPTWLKMQREIRNLPYQMMREAGLEEEDLRIKADIENAYRDNIGQANQVLSDERKAETPSTQSSQAEEQLPSVPLEWFGLQENTSPSFDERKSAEDSQSLEAWTNAPAQVVTGREPNQDQDKN